jgi:uncharacterized membrane protein
LRKTSALPGTSEKPDHPAGAALGLGASAGLRSMLAPALLSRAAARGELVGLEETPFAALASPKAAKVLAALAVGEAVADKTPVVPGRASVPVLLQRAATGAAVGGALYAARNLDGRVGGALGAVAAVVAAVGGQGFRQAATKAPVPSLLPALVEDAVAVGLGLLALRGIARRR